MRNVLRMKRRGVTLIYAFFACMGLVALIALSVDWGRVQLTKTELHAAAVAAARYAVAGLQNDLAGVSAAPANAAAVAAQNTANGRAIAFNQNQDVEIGVWDTSARTFTPTTDLKVANAVNAQIVLDEPGRRVVVRELDVAPADDADRLVDEERRGAGGALVDGEDDATGHDRPPSDRIRYRVGVAAVDVTRRAAPARAGRAASAGSGRAARPPSA